VENFMRLPTPISPLPFTPGSGPTYTQIFEETMGAAGTKDDGYDAAAAELLAVSTAFGAELKSDPLGVSLGSAAGLFGGVDPASLDAHMVGYVGTKEYGLGIVAAVGGVVEPPLLVLPLTPGDGSVNFIPPQLLTHDFGMVKFGSAPQSYSVGGEVDDISGQVYGITVKGFVDAVPGVFDLRTVERDFTSGTVAFDYFIDMTPAIVGQWTAQFEYVVQLDRQLVILTLRANVIS
jgi:hypothetical protein